MQIPAPPDHPVIIFDDNCAFCHRGVRLIVAFDRRGIFRFAGRDSAAARWLVSSKLGEAPRPNSMLLIDGDSLHLRSDVALQVARRLGFPYNLAYGFTLVPRPIRDWIYDVIAVNRHRLQRGKACPLPTPALRARLLP